MCSLEQALTVPDLPEISQTVLNLAEFMEHCDKGPLPIDPILLGDQAVTCRAYAKALHYKEKEFHKKPTVPVLESLISINNKLGQKEAATGLLEWGSKNLPDLKVHERWYEKLHDWEKALKIYEEKSVENPDDPEIALGRMRCLENLGEWGDLHAVAEAQWVVAEEHTKMRMARMAASASWGRQDWNAMARLELLSRHDERDWQIACNAMCGGISLLIVRSPRRIDRNTGRGATLRFRQ
jgi:FKBP12-rapamycin complex-associated protein